MEPRRSLMMTYSELQECSLNKARPKSELRRFRLAQASSRSRTEMKKVLITFFASLLLCIGCVAAQVPKSNPTATPQEPPLMPLTGAERAVNLNSIVLNQPDFVADE